MVQLFGVSHRYFTFNYFLPLEIFTKEEPIKDSSIQMSGEKDIIESVYYTLSLLSGRESEEANL